ncbi:MAG: hypothetical protein ACREDR_00140, partial [Blastocatellia bacterium]
MSSRPNPRNLPANRPATAPAQRPQTKPSLTIVKLEGMPERPLDRVEDWLALQQTLQDKANVLTHRAQMNYMPPMTQIMVGATFIDPSLVKRGACEVYQDRSYCEEYEVALTKVGLHKLAELAGASFGLPVRMDDRRINYYWEIAVPISVITLDGRTRFIYGYYSLDLRDGQEETLVPEWRTDQATNKRYKTGEMISLSKTALSNKRRVGPELCATKASNRGIRSQLSLKHVYSFGEMAKPFVVPKIVPCPDMSDPDVKKAYLDSLFGARNSLYGQPQLSPFEVPTLDGHEIDLSNFERVDRDDLPPEGTGFTEPPRDDDPPREPIVINATVTTPEPPPNLREVLDYSKQSGPTPADDCAGDFPPLTQTPAPAQTPVVPPEAVCECGVCGCQAPITKAVADATRGQVGGARCAKCYPSRGFE